MSSSPSPPSTVSAPKPPWTWSLPAPPFTVSSPSSSLRRSLPAPPSRTSLPVPPRITSSVAPAGHRVGAVAREDLHGDVEAGRRDLVLAVAHVDADERLARPRARRLVEEAVRVPARRRRGSRPTRSCRHRRTCAPARGRRT